MIPVSEHFYDDDPRRGHPDVRTRLDGVSYFFLGNGRIQAAVQWAPKGEGTPLGLLLMDPERLGRKRDALTCDPDRGLEPTVVRVLAGRAEGTPDAATVRVEWTVHRGVPAVLATWSWNSLTIREVFYCPSHTEARLAREVSVETSMSDAVELVLATGAGLSSLERRLTARPGCPVRTWVTYVLDAASGAIEVHSSLVDPLEDEACRYWAGRTEVRLHDAALDRLFSHSARQLPAVLSARGRMDASIWQYNREWVRDQAFVALALVIAGYHDEAALMLNRLLREFITPDGAPLDSSEVRDRDEVELDQNGVLLYALEQYVLWTDDVGLAARAWDRVTAVAEYPFRPEFRHPSGLLCNRREFWERHDVHGIEPGFELVYQVFVALGLASAASLARRLGHDAVASRWAAHSRALRSAIFGDSQYRLVENGHLVKRRGLDGAVQDRVVALSEARLPGSTPLAQPGAHLLTPDACTVLPIAFRFVAGDSALAAETLGDVEELWNQAWDGGGYGRYHVTSEPDSPGPWPFASLFVARAAVEAGRGDVARRTLSWLETVAGAAAGSWFEFYGPRAAPPFPQVGVIPWTWAELIFLLVSHVLGVVPEESGVRVRPRLLPGMTRAEARIPVRDGHLVLRIGTVQGRNEPLARTVTPDHWKIEDAAAEIVAPYGPGETTVEIQLPG